MRNSRRKFGEIAIHDPACEERRVLLVDNEPDHRRVIRQLLESMGCLVVSARTDHEALALLRTPYMFCMVMMEIEESLKDGITAAAEISRMKERGELGDIPVIAITADDSYENTLRITAAQMEDIVIKHIGKPGWDRFIQRRLERWFPIETYSRPDSNRHSVTRNGF